MELIHTRIAKLAILNQKLAKFLKSWTKPESNVDDKEWRDLVWAEIKELRQEHKELRQETRAILETMTTLKVKIGVVVSIFTGVVTMAWNFVQKKMGE